MQLGIQRRLARIFEPDGRAVVIAMDHAMFGSSPVPGLTDPAQLVEVARAHGADAFIMGIGSARAAQAALGAAGLILSVRPEAASGRVIAEQALRAGADMVKTILCPFEDSFEQQVTAVGQLTAACDAAGLPVMIETVPGGFGAGKEMRTPERLAAAARIAAECGAAVVKTYAAGDVAGMRTITGYGGVPVLVLGGELHAREDGFLDEVGIALEGGAAGVAAGRNVWLAASPARVLAELAARVHRPAAPVPGGLQEAGCATS